jgi:phosphate-selective porin OprO and OprP
MKLKRTLTLAILGGAIAGQTVLADDTANEIKALRQQIEALDQKVRVLERKVELDKESAVEKAKTLPLVTAGPSGFTISSADTNYVLSLHGLVQVDNRTFFGDKGINGNDSFLLRRARPIFQGTIARDFDFLFVPDFGGTSVQIVDAYINYRYRPWLQVRAGRQKVPVGLEQLQSDAVTSFNERSLVTDLVPNRDIGFQIWGDIAGGVASYAVGVYNGVGDSRNTANFDFEDNREFAGRIFLQPFKKSKLPALQGFGFGIAGSYGESSVTNLTGLPGTTGGSLAGYATDGQQQFFAYNPSSGLVAADGTHWRLSPQACYYYGPFSLLAEYAVSDQHVRKVGTATTADLQNTAWEVTAGWVLTGEDASFAGVTPRRPFDPKNGTWGAWQFVARYAELDVDNKAFPLFSNPASSASTAQSWTVGVNWYLNKNVLFKTSYSHTDFTGGDTSAALTSPAAVTRQPEDVWFTRLQLSF